MKNDIWQLQEAKNRFSELVNRAISVGPQVVTRRGEDVVVILSKDAFQAMVAKQSNLADFFRSSPLVGLDLQLERDKSLPRDLDL